MKNCIDCGIKLEWGRFAYNQDICWDCFKGYVKIIIERIEQYPSWLWDKRDTHKEIVSYMMAVVAERFGYEW